MPTRGEKLADLRDFFVESFSQPQLETFLTAKGYDEVAVAIIPDQGVRECFFQVAQELDRRELIDARLFAALKMERPARASQIARLEYALLARDHTRADILRELREIRRKEGASAAEIERFDRDILAAEKERREGRILQAGNLLSGRYVLDSVLGSGGFGQVWRAYDREGKDKGNRDVAIKILLYQHIHDRSLVERFRRGARVMSELEHPNIVRVLEKAEEDHEYIYFVMEFVPGGDLQSAILERRIDEQTVPEIIYGVGQALQFAHEHRAFHRDVKPLNILLSEDLTPKLTDFDLVRVFDSYGGTNPFAGFGTYVFGAPEAIHSAESVDATCDVYSLGMTALFGFVGPELNHMTAWKRRELVEQLDVHPEVKRVLIKAIDSEPSHRYASVAEFCSALREAFRLPNATGPATAVTDAAPPGSDTFGGPTPPATPMATPAPEKNETARERNHIDQPAASSPIEITPLLVRALTGPSILVEHPSADPVAAETVVPPPGAPAPFSRHETPDYDYEPWPTSGGGSDAYSRPDPEPPRFAILVIILYYIITLTFLVASFRYLWVSGRLMFVGTGSFPAIFVGWCFGVNLLISLSLAYSAISRVIRLFRGAGKHWHDPSQDEAAPFFILVYLSGALAIGGFFGYEFLRWGSAALARGRVETPLGGWDLLAIAISVVETVWLAILMSGLLLTGLVVASRSWRRSLRGE